MVPVTGFLYRSVRTRRPLMTALTLLLAVGRLIAGVVALATLVSRQRPITEPLFDRHDLASAPPQPERERIYEPVEQDALVG